MTAENKERGKTFYKEVEKVRQSASRTIITPEDEYIQAAMKADTESLKNNWKG